MQKSLPFAIEYVLGSAGERITRKHHAGLPGSVAEQRSDCIARRGVQRGHLVMRITDVVVVQYTAVESVATNSTADVLVASVVGVVLPVASMRTVLVP